MPTAAVDLAAFLIEHAPIRRYQLSGNYVPSNIFQEIRCDCGWVSMSYMESIAVRDWARHVAERLAAL